jgi:hypothetical protein
MRVVKPTHLGSSEGEKSMLVENLLRRMSCAATLAGAVLLVAAGPASATVLGGSSDQGPAMVQFGDLVCAAWSGTDSSHHLNFACGNPLVGNFTTITTNQFSTLAPALAVYQNTVWMAWTGTNNALNIAALPMNGNNMLEAFGVGNNDASNQAPALAVAEINGVQELVMAWTGTDSKHHLNVASSLNVDPPSTWSATTTLNQLASGGPSLAFWNNNLYIGWTGTDSQLNFAMAAANSTQFGAAQFVKVAGGGNMTSSNAPSLTTTANLNYGWRGSGNDIFIAFYNNTTPPNAVAAVIGNSGVATGFSPALFTYNGQLWIGWIDGNNNLQAELLP